MDPRDGKEIHERMKGIGDLAARGLSVSGSPTPPTALSSPNLKAMVVVVGDSSW
jgi:hypothetical protein